MKEGIRELVKQTSSIIKYENIKINNLRREIDSYEAIISVISLQENQNNMIRYYRNKITECYLKIDRALEKIQHNKNIVDTMRYVDKIIKRGEKSA